MSPIAMCLAHVPRGCLRLSQDVRARRGDTYRKFRHYSRGRDWPDAGRYTRWSRPEAVQAENTSAFPGTASAATGGAYQVEMVHIPSAGQHRGHLCPALQLLSYIHILHYTSLLLLIRQVSLNRPVCHSERSEESTFQSVAMPEHRFFAALRMTGEVAQ